MHIVDIKQEQGYPATQLLFPQAPGGIVRGDDPGVISDTDDSSTANILAVEKLKHELIIGIYELNATESGVAITAFKDISIPNTELPRLIQILNDVLTAIQKEN